MRRVHIALLASLQLCGARQHGFSIHDDVVAYPQYEIIFSDAAIPEKEAEALLKRAAQAGASPTYEAQFSQTDLTSQTRESNAAEDGTRDGAKNPRPGAYGDDASDGSPQVSETYEVMNVPPSRYLCTLPVLAPPSPTNHTATELAKVEEAREHSRASVRGWELMQPLDGTCMYFVSGWWSYSFCYGKEVVQFHASASSLKGNGPPVRDPQSLDYVLGRATIDASASQSGERKGASKQQDVLKQDKAPSGPPPNTELQVKGDQRYLVQRLGDGTICDLTGRERTIEIQYHCNPTGTSDRIYWIREVTTCTYLMEIQTPRLCEDAAFLPPKPTRAHPINCRLIDESSKRNSLPGDKKNQPPIPQGMAAKMGIEQMRAGQFRSGSSPQSPKSYHGMNIGGRIVGAREKLGQLEDALPAGTKLTGQSKSRNSASTAAALAAVLMGKMKGTDLDGQVTDIIAEGQGRAAGGQVSMMSDEELRALKLQPEAVQGLRRELEAMAGDRSWRLEMVEIAEGVSELRAIMDPEDQAGGDEGAGGDKKGAAKAKPQKGQLLGKVKDKSKQKDQAADAAGRGRDNINKGKARGGGGMNPGAEEDEEEQGSEEQFFRDEL